jgi:predicted GIY-YIG superfamily endonuclease
VSTVYLLHFNERYPAGRRPGHYLGVARDFQKRMAEHRRGNPGKGGSLTRALAARGIGFLVAQTWEFEDSDDAFAWERGLKRSRHHHRLCPICTPVPRRIAELVQQAQDSPVQSDLIPQGPPPTGSRGPSRR